jgi:hypothetical protein
MPAPVCSVLMDACVCSLPIHESIQPLSLPYNIVSTTELKPQPLPSPFHSTTSEMDKCHPPPYDKQSGPELDHLDRIISNRLANIRQIMKDSLAVHHRSEFTRLLTQVQQVEQQTLDIRTVLQQARRLAPSYTENGFSSQDPSIQTETRPQVVGEASKSCVDTQIMYQPHSAVTETETKKPRKLLSPSQTKVYRRNEVFHVPSLDKWSPIPWSFEDLVALNVENGEPPAFWRIPHVMVFQEFQGYPWKFNAIRSPQGNDHTLDTMNRRDQAQFARILEATIRSGRRPFISPDYFLLAEDKTRKCDLKRLFECRGEFPDRKWDLFTPAKMIERHPDWPMFCQYVKAEIPTGKFLFKRERGDWIWLSRMIVEEGYLEVDQEIVGFVQSLGGRLRFPKQRLFRSTKWTADDLLEIKSAANRFWLQWRLEAEQELAETVS